MNARTYYEAAFSLYRGELVPVGDPQLTQILKYIPPSKDCAILDAGCGSGRYGRTLIAKGYKNISCIDVVEPNETAAPPNYRQASLDKLPFPDAAFDFIYANSVVYYLPDPRMALAELKRVSKPGAAIVISGHAVTSPATTWRRLKRSVGARSARHLDGARFHSPQYYARIFRSLGFSDIRYDGFTRPWLIGKIAKRALSILLRPIGLTAKDVPYYPAKSRWYGFMRALLAYHFIIVAKD